MGGPGSTRWREHRCQATPSFPLGRCPRIDPAHPQPRYRAPSLNRGVILPTSRGVQIKPIEIRQLEVVGAELDAEHERRHALTPMKSDGASPSRRRSRNRT